MAEQGEFDPTACSLSDAHGRVSKARDMVATFETELTRAFSGRAGGLNDVELFFRELETLLDQAKEIMDSQTEDDIREDEAKDLVSQLNDAAKVARAAGGNR